MESSKTCLFCDTKIPYRYITCREHVSWLTFSGEVWFKEISRMDGKQTRINVRECHPLTDQDRESVPVGRGIDKAMIRTLKETMTIKEIAELLNSPVSTIKSALYRKTKKEKAAREAAKS